MIKRLSVVAYVALFLIAVCIPPLAGCSGPSGAPANQGASTETTPGQFPATTPNPGQQPPPPALKDPRTAVYSYLLWISYAYRVLNSDVASFTFTPEEEVRVNSYVMYNFQEGRAIDQRLLVANIKSSKSKGDTATVAMHEEWIYRYISTQTGTYTSEPLEAAYDTTYTLVRQDGNWLVHSVAATSSAGIK
ncbi:MAG: hypothetical protein HGB10_09615 [Coriobacteriia bacterium]|nr:hypothetical protein [Coriobacteriia bacterium]